MSNVVEVVVGVVRGVVVVGGARATNTKQSPNLKEITMRIFVIIKETFIYTVMCMECAFLVPSQKNSKDA